MATHNAIEVNFNRCSPYQREMIEYWRLQQGMSRSAFCRYATLKLVKDLTEEAERKQKKKGITPPKNVVQFSQEKPIPKKPQSEEIPKEPPRRNAFDHRKPLEI